MNIFTATSGQKRESIRHAFFKSRLKGLSVDVRAQLNFRVLPFIPLSVLALILLLSSSSLAQKRANNWYTSSDSYLNFNTSPATFYSGATTTNFYSRSITSISDNTGIALFTLGAGNVYLPNGSIMTNGQSVSQIFSHTNNAIAVPRPGSANEYFIFSAENQNAYYSVVDMTVPEVRAGQKKLPLYTSANSYSTKVTAVKGNQNNYWVIFYGQTISENKSVFKVYSFEASGVIEFVDEYNFDTNAAGSTSVGNIKVSPDRKKIAVSNYQHAAQNPLILFDFDVSDGSISNPKPIDNVSTTYSFYGIDFTHDSKYLYASSQNSNTIYRYYLNAGGASEIAGSKQVVRSGSFGVLQLGPDKNIYVLGPGTGVLLNPSSSDVSNISYQTVSGLPNGGYYFNFNYPVNLIVNSVELTNNSIAENNATGAAIGELSASFEDGSTNAAFTLVAGEASTDNAAFTIDGTTLKAAVAFDYEAKPSYSVRVRATPASNTEVLEEVFTIQVTDLDEIKPSVAVTSSSTSPTDDNPVRLNLAFSEDVTGFVIGDITVTGGTANNFSGNGKNYTVDVIPAAATVKIDVAANVAQDAAGNGSTAATQFSIVYNIPNFVPTNIALSATSINENVAVGTIVGAFSSTDADAGDTHTYTLVTGDGSADNAAFEIAGNQLKAKASLDYETKSTYSIRVKTNDGKGGTLEKAFAISVNDLDDTAPAVPFVSAPANDSFLSNTKPTISGTAEAGSTVAVILDGAVLGTTTANGSGAWSFTPSSPLAEKAYVITATATDDANNNSGESSAVTTTIDITAPKVSVLNLPGDNTYNLDSKSELHFYVEFSEPVQNAAASYLSIKVGNAARTAYGYAYDISADYYYTVQDGEAATGVEVTSLATDGTTITDKAGNELDLSAFTKKGSDGVRVDGIRPAITKVEVPANKTYVKGEHLDVTVAFSEKVQVVEPVILLLRGEESTEESDPGERTPFIPVTVGNRQVNAQYFTGSGTAELVFRYTVEEGDLDTDGVELAAEVMGGDPMPPKLQPAEFKRSPMMGAAVLDLAGNSAASLALSNVPSTVGVLVDAVAPTLPDVTIASSNAANTVAKVGDIVTVSITASEAINSPKVTIAGHEAKVEKQSEATYTASYTMAEADGEGTVAFSISLSDLAGNNAVAVAATTDGSSVTFDRVAPAIIGVADNGKYNAGITISFNEGTATLNGAAFTNGGTVGAEGGYTLEVTDVAGNTATINFRVDKTAPTATLAINNGATHTNSTSVTLVLTTADGTGTGVADMRFSNNNTAWSVWEPIADTKNWQLNSADGSKSVYAQVRDAAGNVTTVSGSIIFDATLPGIELATIAPDVVNAPFTVSFSFSEEVTGFEEADITVDNGLASVFTKVSATVYSALVTPTADGEVRVSVAADAANDAATNGNTVPNTVTHIYDVARPTVAVASSAPENLNSGFDVTVTFTEDITGFEAGDLVVVNGRVAYYPPTSNKEYTFRITPAADGEVSISVPANVAQDIASNGNEASNTVTRVYDATKPTVALTTTAANPTNAPFTVEVAFSEAVSGLELADFTAANAVASDLTASGDRTYTVVITPAADGETSVALAASAVADIATNGNAASETLRRLYDATEPAGYAVTFNTSQVNVTNAAGTALEVTGAEVGTAYYYSITSSSGGAPVTGTAEVTAAGFSIPNLDLTGLNDGRLTVALYLQDAATNQGADATAQVVKITRNVVTVTTPALIKVPIRTTYANVPLPATVAVTYSNGEKAEIGVRWQQGAYNGAVSATYTLTGTLVLADMTTNLDNLGAAVSVEVQPNKVPAALSFSAATFKPEATADDVIGTLTTTDPDDSEFVYELAAGQGDVNNALFEIRNDKVYLKSNKGLSGMTAFSIRVRSTDPYRNTIEKGFTLTKAPYGKPEDQLKIVNAFSPNGDGINDNWAIPELRFYNNVYIQVFDRSGVRVFETTDPETGWNGRSTNGRLLKGPYMYIIEVKDINWVKRGVVTILSK